MQIPRYPRSATWNPLSSHFFQGYRRTGWQFYLETPFNRATAVFCSYCLKFGRSYLKFQNYFLPVIFRSVKYALQTTFLLLLTQATYLRWLSPPKKTTYKLHNTTRIKRSLYTSEGNVGKKAICSFPVCLPCCLHVCPALISFSLSDRTGTISEGGKVWFMKPYHIHYYWRITSTS